MQVSEVMHKGVITAQIHDSIKKVAALMKKNNIGAVPIYKNERPVGFVTDRDIVVSAVAQGQDPETPISVAMTREIISVNSSDEVGRAEKIMRDNQISRVLVVDSGETPVGMLSLQDIAKSSASSSEVLSGIKR